MPVSLLLFRGFGSDQRVCISGQVVLGGHLPEEPHPANKSRWSRLKYRFQQVVRLMLSQQVPPSRLRVRWGAGSEAIVSTDTHGYFFQCLSPGVEPSNQGWGSYQAQLVEPPPPETVTGEAEILTASPRAQRIIVSDIDDTVIFTGVANKLAMLWRLFVQRAGQRVPFPGISDLYQGLHRGNTEAGEHNPMIYLSRSPWSLYPTLEELFQVHGIPVGPVLLLRDWGITLRHPFPRRAPDHKWDMLMHVCQVYPDLPLVLIGDSGQHDPELYAAFCRERPHQVAAICIRELDPAARRWRELYRLRRGVEALGIPWVGVRNTFELARFMFDHGWISPEDLARVGEHFGTDSGASAVGPDVD